MLKKVMLLIFSFVIIFFVPTSVSANGIVNEDGQYIEYQLDSDNTKIFTINDNGEDILIIIEKLSNTSRSIEDGTYKISTSKEGSWYASFQITVNDYKIVSASSPIANAITGSFVSKELRIDSPTMATYYLKRRIALVILDKYLRAQIIDKTLRVTVK